MIFAQREVTSLVQYQLAEQEKNTQLDKISVMSRKEQIC